ncbi:hypothetical protein JXE04_01460 [Patescibacteria group bacterium]|nr:hypothetical protein [Patescibacteria group bacterium]
MKLKKHFILTLLLLLFFSFVFFNQVKALSDSNEAINESDAIAVRILPNPNHYSAARWYKSQGFSGSPQALLVDSYDAVRDGRTVYVNAANISGNTIYTNIYLISYNQDPNIKTVDVLGQIVDHWQFNSNLSGVGSCSISTLSCNDNNECGQGLECSSNSSASGRCQLIENDNCYTDDDCPQGLYCDNLRSMVARDVRRLGVLGNLREALAVFKQINNKYPVLSAGTYVPLNSLSVWPSWQALFLPQIGVSQREIDSINRLGICDGFDSITCWNKETQNFADPQPNNSTLELPANSYVFAYSSDSNGSNYNLCAVMETKALGYNTAEGQLSNLGCIASGSGYTGYSNNLAPVLIDTKLYGEQNQEFNGFIKVIDPENNSLDWSINTSGTWGNWSSAPILMDTYNPNQKKIYAVRAGNVGTYNLILNVVDSEGAIMSTNTPIVISNNEPLIQSDDIDYYPSTVIPLAINFSITDKDYPLSYTITKFEYDSGPYDLLSSSKSTFLGETSRRSGDTTYYTLKYRLNTSNKFLSDTVFVYSISAKDHYGMESTRKVTINVKVDQPILDFNCAKTVRVGSAYYCGLGWQKQGDHTINYTVVGSLPDGLSISNSSSLDISYNVEPINTKPWQKFLSWLGIEKNNFLSSAEAADVASYYALQGTPNVSSVNNLIKIKAENEFGAVSQREFNLSINNYCGDGIRQQPNLEGRGGFYNDGQESCDGDSNIVLNRIQIPASSADFQYACTTKPGDIVPYPIMNNQYFCTFSDDQLNGGFCGDGVCQYSIERNGNIIPWEGVGYCNIDCGDCGINASYNGSDCVCNSGFYDCSADILGCESSSQCGDACPSGQYECDGKCVIENDLSPACDSISQCSSSLKGDCSYCETGYYNCDYSGECESFGVCTCPAGTSWNKAVWPYGQCVVDNIGCTSEEGLCGNQCYDLKTEKCCDADSSSVCPTNKYCCLVGDNNVCSYNALQCQKLKDAFSTIK